MREKPEMAYGKALYGQEKKRDKYDHLPHFLWHSLIVLEENKITRIIYDEVGEFKNLLP